jgi:hypothetical protein
MTREHRLVLSLDEITAIRWQCPHCQVAISYPLDQTIRLPPLCPSCGADALEQNRTDHHPYHEFVRALKALRHAPQAAGTLRMAFLGEPDTRPAKV